MWWPHISTTFLFYPKCGENVVVPKYDENGLEIDRFYGYLPAYEFMMKMEDVISGENTFTYYLDEYNKKTLKK